MPFSRDGGNSNGCSIQFNYVRDSLSKNEVSCLNNKNELTNQTIYHNLKESLLSLITRPLSLLSSG